jgi:hypothetical protein
MIMRTPITRVPIKIRNPIHKQFCNCWGIQTFAIEGVPQFIKVDGLTNESMSDFLHSTPVCLPIHFMEFNESNEMKIRMALGMGVPVVIRTNTVLPHWLLQALKEVPHSGIQISMNFLDEVMRNRLERGASDIFELRKMISLAKSWKIFISLVVEHQPHLVSKLDLYEMVDMVKNYVSHIFISYPSFSDVLVHEAKSMWESLRTSSSDKFRQYYMPDVPARAWVIRPRYMQEITEGLSEYLKGKKIGLEVVDHHLKYNGYDRIRHQNSGLSDLPMGIRPFFYEKTDELFKEVESVEGFTCKKCEKPIFA